MTRQTNASKLQDEHLGIFQHGQFLFRFDSCFFSIQFILIWVWFFISFYFSRKCFVLIYGFILNIWSICRVQDITCVTPRRLRTRSDVQRRVSSGKPSPGCGLQAASWGQLWHLPEPQQEAETEPEKTCHWYGDFFFVPPPPHHAHDP